jgi:hypothetical protein
MTGLQIKLVLALLLDRTQRLSPIAWPKDAQEAPETSVRAYRARSHASVLERDTAPIWPRDLTLLKSRERAILAA